MPLLEVSQEELEWRFPLATLALLLFLYAHGGKIMRAVVIMQTAMALTMWARARKLRRLVGPGAPELHDATSINIELAVAYGTMVVSQLFGGSIIGLLHGEAARVRAEQPPADAADLSYDAGMDRMCAAYERHHFDPYSNVLHVAGCVLAIGYIGFAALTSNVLSSGERLRLLACVPPLWYLYAWAGHFFIQKDIPAVFNYGTTARGLVTGEWCALKATLMGRTVSAPWELLLTAVVIAGHVTFVLLWRMRHLLSGANTKPRAD